MSKRQPLWNNLARSPREIVELVGVEGVDRLVADELRERFENALMRYRHLVGEPTTEALAGFFSDVLMEVGTVGVLLGAALVQAGALFGDNEAWLARATFAADLLAYVPSSQYEPPAEPDAAGP